MEGIIFVDEATYMIALVSMSDFTKMTVVPGMFSMFSSKLATSLEFTSFTPSYDSVLEKQPTRLGGLEATGGKIQIQI